MCAIEVVYSIAHGLMLQLLTDDLRSDKSNHGGMMYLLENTVQSKWPFCGKKEKRGIFSFSCRMALLLLIKIRENTVMSMLRACIKYF